MEWGQIAAGLTWAEPGLSAQLPPEWPEIGTILTHLKITPPPLYLSSPHLLLTHGFTF